MEKPKFNLPDKEISVASLSKQLSELNNKQHKYYYLNEKWNVNKEEEVIQAKIHDTNTKLKQYLTKILTDFDDIPAEYINENISNIRNQISSYCSTCIKNVISSGNEIKNIREENSALILELKELKDYTVEIKDITNQIETAEQTNKDIRYRDEYAKAENMASDAKVEYDQETQIIEDLRTLRKQIFKDSKMPVEGLTLNEDGIFLDDSRYENLSSSKKLLVSMKIGMALNPNMKVMFSKHGNDFDDERIKILLNEANTHGYQLIIERINPVEGAPYIIIEDGSLSIDAVPHSDQNNREEVL